MLNRSVVVQSLSGLFADYKCAKIILDNHVVIYSPYFHYMR